MAKISPFYSVKSTDRAVYHNNSKCTEGNNIEPENRRNGTGNRPLCSHCSRLNSQGK